MPATELAREHLGRPLPNAALLGGFAALTGVVSLDSVEAAIRERFPARRPTATSPRHAPRSTVDAERGAGSMLRQIEGSRAVAEAVALLPAGGDLRLSDLAADAHRRGPLASW